MMAAQYVTAIRVADGTKQIDYNALANLPEIPSIDGLATVAQLEDKVNKEAGKGLSSNDYTTADKEKLENIEKNGNGLSFLGPIYLIGNVHYFDSIDTIPEPYESGRLYLVKVEE